ncbi:MAG: hypothetical protein LBU99_00970 [Spirochaetaceae bacterium]|jgi:hypothetical protein|nr:hypothetical protein [Spirochaetaceae bacterium]
MDTKVTGETAPEEIPLAVVTAVAGQGLKTVGCIILMVILFLLPNSGFIIAGIVDLIRSGFGIYNGLFAFLIAVLGAGICILAGYLTYIYLLINTIQKVYSFLEPQFRAICGGIASKITDGASGTVKKGYDWAADAAGSISASYTKKIPFLVRKAVRFILEQIPFADIIYHVSIDTGTGDEQALGNSLYTQVDAYVTEKFFEENNSLKWIFWLLPLNIAVQYVLLRFIAP